MKLLVYRDMPTHIYICTALLLRNLKVLDFMLYRFAGSWTKTTLVFLSENVKFYFY